jgi:hypothetical protein
LTQPPGLWVGSCAEAAGGSPAFAPPVEACCACPYIARPTPINASTAINTKTAIENPQQVVPGAEVSLEAQALRDLETCNNFPLDRLVTLVWSLADKTILVPRLIKVRNKLVRQRSRHNFDSLLMLAVTAGAFLLIFWIAIKGLFFFIQESLIR